MVMTGDEEDEEHDGSGDKESNTTRGARHS